MTTEVLGSYSFTAAPTVNGNPVVLNDGTVPSLAAADTSVRPTAGIAGRVFIDTTVLGIFIDNGSSWDEVGSNINLSGSANQISIAQTAGAATISLANDTVLPGTGGFTPPSGTTAQRPVAPLTAATRWNSTLGLTELYNGAVWQPQGRVLQNITGAIAQSSGTMTTGLRWTLGSTAPTTAQGFQIWTQTVTPVSAVSKFIIRCALSVAYGSTNTPIYLAIYSGSTCIAMTMTSASAVAGQSVNIAINIAQASVSTAALTLSARIGVSAGTSTLYWNQSATALPAAMVTEFEIEEIL